ncbi:envelope stress response activation lipoprotein NlpE [Affinibrenneria salicis]|uniref:Envelope stress response activation lipoprotein NlpE n=1 Tax=Affinibrenneria salicis TaxID=2590031 RepID=A0A5J5FSW2_9GAMM|nr:envelope stress response activation lipoprotein NlpE [Affinibrenneria salicis]KAA8996118.1 envelope stress response activation lipoprotein NlpE [Affinibrenneria salicis]
MKTLTTGILLALGLSILIGCHSRAVVQEASLRPMPQSYRGVLPCADCSGIETTLFLDTDGTFVLTEHYQSSRPGTDTFSEYGLWARTADKLVLTRNDGDKRYFRPRDNGLEVLSTDGAPIKSSLNYRLDATETPLPVTPMSMQGLYRYMAEASLFTDCFTGKTLPVVSNLTLEKQYLSLGTRDGAPALMSLEAHFALVPSVKEGQTVKSVVPDSQKIKLDASQHCPL